MSITPTILPALIQAVETTLRHHQDEVTALDVAIGDGDHVINLQRGISVLVGQSTELATLDSFRVAKDRDDPDVKGGRSVRIVAGNFVCHHG